MMSLRVMVDRKETEIILMLTCQCYLMLRHHINMTSTLKVQATHAGAEGLWGHQG